jgi:hypothetical protein
VISQRYPNAAFTLQIQTIKRAPSMKFAVAAGKKNSVTNARKLTEFFNDTNDKRVNTVEYKPPQGLTEFEKVTISDSITALKCQKTAQNLFVLTFKKQ